MLGKAIKHEFKVTGRSFLPLYALVLITTPLLALLAKLFPVDLDSSLAASPLIFISVMSIVGYVALLVGVGVASFVLIIMRFYRSMTKESAYLTFMLPVKTSGLVFSKLLVAFVWQIASLVIITLSIGIYTFAWELWTFNDLSKVWNLIKGILDAPDAATRSQIILLLILYILTMIVGCITGILQVYVSISLGQLANKHRLAASFGFYIALYIVTQLISSIFLLPINLLANTMETATDVGTILNTQILIIVISLAITLVYGIIYYIVTTYMFKKHLNLE